MQMNLQNRKRLIDLENELMVAWKRMCEEGTVSEFGMLHLKWIANKNLLDSTWNSAQCYVAAWMGGEIGGEWIHVYM